MTEIKYQRSVLSNGLQVISGYHPAAPLTVVALYAAAGSRYEQAGEFGYAHFAEHITFDGTTKFPSRELLATEIDRLGASVNAHTSKEMVRWYLQVATSQTTEALALMAEMLRCSLVTDESIAHEKNIIQEEIARDGDIQNRVLGKQSYIHLFGDHPLGHSVLGDPVSVAGATAAQVRAYLDRWLIPTGSVLVVVGGWEHEPVVAGAEKYFGTWPATSPTTLAAESIQPPTERNNFVSFPAQRTAFTLNYLTGWPDELNQSIWEVITVFLGQGRSSLLFKKLRTELGLAYELNGFYNVFRDTGVFQIRSSSTKPREAIKALRDIMSQVADQLTPAEFERARERAQRIAWQASYSSLLNEADILGSEALAAQKIITPPDQQRLIASVTYDDTRQMMRQFLRPEQGYLTVVGPENPAS